MFWSTSLSEDRKKYFASYKTLAMPIKGKINIDGVRKECSGLLTEDSFRSHPNYPVNYFFATM